MKINNILIPALLAFSISACKSGKEQKKVSEKQETFQYMTLKTHAVSETIKLPGVLQPFEFVQIFPKVNGFVKDVFVDRGSVVKKGQVLLRLEAPEVDEHRAAARLKYVEAVATLQATKDKYTRLLETSRTPGTVSASELTTAYSRMMADSATVQGELANYKAQETMYSYLTVTAPFDGVISERNIHPGALVGPGAQGTNKPMLVLQQQNLLRLVVNLPEQYTMQVKDGQAVKFHVNALPGQEFTGSVSRSSGSLSDNFRSETIEIDVPNNNLKFKAGMYAEVMLPAGGNAHAFEVPRKAVVTTTERKYVVSVDNGKAKLVDVSEGNQGTDSTEIFGKLRDGDSIVSNATYEIEDGALLSTR